jgi:folate-binding protein YgfZ
MDMGQSAILTERAIVSVAGTGARDFLQGLVTNDMAECGPGRAIYAGLLTPQGKILYDFLVTERSPEEFLLDAHTERAEELLKRLQLYRLRGKIAVLRTTLGVAASWGNDSASPALSGVTSFRDPRLSLLGWRSIGSEEELASFATASGAEYHRHRIALGVPDSSDLPPDQIFPLDAGFEELNGVSFRKGCFVGQEVTARMKHRATARRRMLIAEADPLPARGATIEAEGRELGSFAGGAGNHALALVRLDRWSEAEANGVPITANGVPVRLQRPDWMRV